MMAAVNGHWGVVDGLLLNGADPHEKDEVSCFWRSMTVLT
jgi:hypothetical protein